MQFHTRARTQHTKHIYWNAKKCYHFDLCRLPFRWLAVFYLRVRCMLARQAVLFRCGRFEVERLKGSRRICFDRELQRSEELKGDEENVELGEVEKLTGKWEQCAAYR